MPPETQESKPAAKADKTDYSKLVDKHFEANHEKGLNAFSVYQVAACIPSMNFANIGQKPAFRLHRVMPTGGVHYEPCEQFVRDHTECEYVA